AEVRRLALLITELSTLIRQLDASAKQTTSDARAVLLSAITRNQDALTKTATALLAKLDTPARLAGVDPPKPEDFRQIATLAAAGKTVEALTELEKLALALERIASSFEKWATDRGDPKIAIKQLVLWQEDLLARLRSAIKIAPFQMLPAEMKVALRAEQKAIHAMVVSLALPPDTRVKNARENVTLHTGKANDLLAGDGLGADTAMKAAGDALTQLAENTPTIPERLSKMRGEVEKLKQEQDTLSNSVELALRGHDRQLPDAVTMAAFARKLAPLVEKQRKQIAVIAALDLPGLSARQTRFVNALKLATLDLQEGAPYEVVASQAWVKREFERLKLVLDGFSSPDAKADELHRKLTTLADSLDAFGPNITADQLKPALLVIQDVSKQLGLFVPTESPALLNDARNALQTAEAAFRDAKPDEVRGRIRTAAEMLGKFSDRLNGFETDLDRVYRLSGNRWLAVERAMELSRIKAPFNPTASDEALRQLGYEFTELTNTRVGAAGQVHKHRVLALLAALRKKNEPDRLGSDQKALAKALDELAAMMADVSELSVPDGRTPPIAIPLAAESFLPSKPLADALREIAKRQRLLSDPLTNLADDLAGRLRPAADNPFVKVEPKQRALALDIRELANQLASDKEHVPAEIANKSATAAMVAADRLQIAHVQSAKDASDSSAKFLRELAALGVGKPWGKRAEELALRQSALLDETTALSDLPNAAAAQQITRAEELARKALELAKLLELTARVFGPEDPAGLALGEAATMVRDAEKKLTESAKKASEGNTVDAEKLRAECDSLLRSAAEKVTDAAPKLPAGGPTLAHAATGVSLRSAEVAMRKAMEDLASGNLINAEKSMRNAATALQHAATTLGQAKK
ncbi:MAG: hypothetical protein L0241_26270, partial [Planctomycetia bacterium]|nr:hypothetical protein [Planctomycetia bacterium]